MWTTYRKYLLGIVLMSCVFFPYVVFFHSSTLDLPKSLVVAEKRIVSPKRRHPLDESFSSEWYHGVENPDDSHSSNNNDLADINEEPSDNDRTTVTDVTAEDLSRLSISRENGFSSTDVNWTRTIDAILSVGSGKFEKVSSSDVDSEEAGRKVSRTSYKTDKEHTLESGDDIESQNPLMSTSIPSDFRDLNDPNRVQVIIVTTKRSGSSFVGELFNSNPNIFYMYEPLFVLTFDALAGRLSRNKFSSAAFDIWNHILRCNYSAPYPQTTSWLKRGGLDSCNTVGAFSDAGLLCPVRRIPLRNLANYLSYLCRNRTYTVLKTIRVNDINQLQKFLNDSHLNLKIIHLVRDPRAVMNSRRHLQERNSDLLRRKGPRADEVADLCQHMARNLKYRNDQPPWLKGKYMLVRYEDVATNPVEMTKEIYDFLGMEVQSDVIRWIEKNTHASGEQSQSPFSRSRNTSAVVEAWKRSISPTLLREVESKCNRIITELSYE